VERDHGLAGVAARSAAGALAQAATWALDFADRISTAVAAAYLDETEHLARARASTAAPPS
jgi:hypothetical protein